jgi:hypothetical protein
LHVVLAAVADSANISLEGNLNLLGIFDTLRAERLPHRHSMMVLAFRMRGEYEDGTKEAGVPLTVSLVDADGRQIWGAVISVKPPKLDPGVFSHLDQIIAFRDLSFPKAGRYTFRIHLEGRDPHDVVFQIVPASKGA